MKRELAWLVSIVTLFAVGLIIGCGGGGGGGSTSSSGTSIFAQDDLNTNYSNVWVTIESVSVVKNGTSQTVFDDTANGGKVVDLRSLHDSSGALFLLLGQAPPSGPFQSVTVTVASQLSIVPTGTSTAILATFQGATGPTFPLTLTLSSSTASPGPGSLLIDFNLANWTLTGTTVSAPNNAYLSVGNPAGFTLPGRQMPNDFLGKVTGLAGTAPNQTFSLNGPFAVTVQTSSSTVIFNSDGSVNASLSTAQSAGDFALVSGSYDATSKLLTATSIKLISPTDVSLTPGVGGTVMTDNSTSGALTIQVSTADSWLPSTLSLTIDVTSSTAFIDASGVSDTESEFFAALTTGTSKVFANGPVSNGVMQATTIRIVGNGGSGLGGGLGGGNEAAFQGSISNVNASAGTFDLTISAWEGFSAGNLTTIHVTTSPSTQFLGSQTSNGFFSSLTSTSQASVRGTLDTSTATLAATAVGTGTVLTPGSGHISL